MAEIKKLVCIICPVGCKLEAACDREKSKIENITGNRCKRGKEYAQSECFSPVRTLTGTVAMDGRAGMVPVKSQKPVPKALLLDCMKEVNRCRLHNSVKIGDVVIKNILNTGVNIVATGNALKNI